MWIFDIFHFLLAFGGFPVAMFLKAAKWKYLMFTIITEINPGAAVRPLRKHISILGLHLKDIKYLVYLMSGVLEKIKMSCPFYTPGHSRTL